MLIGILLSFLLLIPSPVRADENYCEDTAVWEDWQERTAKHPDDTALQTLHALWIGLCVKVQRNEMALAQAIDIFEHVRQQFVERRREYNAGKEEKPEM